MSDLLRPSIPTFREALPARLVAGLASVPMAPEYVMIVGEDLSRRRITIANESTTINVFVGPLMDERLIRIYPRLFNADALGPYERTFETSGPIYAHTPAAGEFGGDIAQVRWWAEIERR